MMRFARFLSLVAALGITSAACADPLTFNLSESGTDFNVSALLTAIPGSGSTYQITGISGSVTFENVTTAIDSGTFLADPSGTTLENPDGTDTYDQLYTPGTTPFDYDGLWFQDANGDDINLYSIGSTNYFSTTADGETGEIVFLPGTPTNIVTVAATPEPSSLMLLGTGIVGLAGIARRRSHKA